MNERVVILGAGESGVGAALLAKAKGYDVFVSDAAEISGDRKRTLLENNIQFEGNEHSSEWILNADLVIKSPGIPDTSDIVLGLLAKGVPVISELEFAFRFTNAKIIAITGTNGKTTTTLLTYHLLKTAGVNVGLAGNIGTSFALQVINDEFDYYVLEVSSFQLDGMYDFKADVAVLLNITPDHLDRYENEMENYVDSKFRITRNLSLNESFIYYSDDRIIKEEIERRNVTAKHFQISFSGHSGLGAQPENTSLRFLIEDNKEFKIPMSEIPMKGKHNLINTMAATLAVSLVGLSADQIVGGLHSFKNAPHRLEVVTKVNGITFVNDSKATNVEAVKYALESFDGKLVWIAGGTDKGNEYEAIKHIVVSRVKSLICLGKDNQKLIDAFGDIIKTTETENMEVAIGVAYQMAKEGDVILLSPACASFDLFKNYMDRGDQFKEAVMSLKRSLIDA